MWSLASSMVATMIMVAGVSAGSLGHSTLPNPQPKHSAARPAPPSKRGHEAMADMYAGAPSSFSPRIARPDRRSRPSPCPSVTKTGYIEVKDITQTIGYVDRNPNQLGIYGITQNVAEVLTVSFAYSACPSSAEPIDLLAVNGPLATSYPFLGGVVGAVNGFDLLSLETDSYIYLGGTSQSIPNSPPYKVGNSHTAGATDPTGSESAIWTYDVPSGLLTPQWVNADGSQPDTSIVYQPETDSLLLTGDPTAFSSSWGASPAVTFSFIPTN